MRGLRDAAVGAALTASALALAGAAVLLLPVGARARAPGSPSSSPSPSRSSRPSSGFSSFPSRSPSPPRAASSSPSSSASSPSSPSSPASSARPDDDEDDAPLVAEVARVKSAARDPSAEGTRALIAALSSPDAIAVVEAADALVARRSREGAAALASVDLHRTEGAALAIVDALGKLAAYDRANVPLATARLLALLADERARNTPESGAILLQIYEALGDTRDSDALAALERELVDPTVPNAAKVVVVGAIVRIGAPSSRDALVRARAAISSREADPFDEAVRRELLGAIDAALAG